MNKLIILNEIVKLSFRIWYLYGIIFKASFLLYILYIDFENIHLYQIVMFQYAKNATENVKKYIVTLDHNDILEQVNLTSSLTFFVVLEILKGNTHFKGNIRCAALVN